MLIFPTCVVEFEGQNQWNHAVEYLMEDWRTNKEDLNKTLCAATEAWFVLVFYEQLSFAEYVTRKKLEEQLYEVSDYAFRHFSHEGLFKLFFGYMMSSFPYWFSAPGKGEYEDAFLYNEQLGIDMCEQVYRSEPNNIIAKLFVLRWGDLSFFTKIAKQGKDELDRLFPDGRGAVIDYFRLMLS